MANNKRKDFGIDSFIDEVRADQKANQKPARAQREYGEQSKAPIGRPSRTNTLLQRKLAKLVYMDEETDQQLKMMKVMHNYDYKELIFTAVREFIDRHYKDMRLDEEGCANVDKVIEKYKVRE